MDEVKVLFGLVTVLFGANAGVYIMVIRHIRATNAQLGKVYDTINDKMEAKVDAAVCEEVQKANSIQFEYLKEGQKELKTLTNRILEAVTKPN